MVLRARAEEREEVFQRKGCPSYHPLIELQCCLPQGHADYSKHEWQDENFVFTWVDKATSAAVIIQDACC